MIARLSLRSRLLVLLAILLGLLWAGLELSARRAAQEQARAEMMEELRATTDLLAAISAAADLGAETRRAILGAARRGRGSPLDKPAYQLLAPSGQAMRSGGFPEFPAAPPQGIATLVVGAERWHVLTLVDADRGTTRQAALTETARRDRARMLRDDLTAPWAVALPIFAIAVLASIWFGLRALRAIERRMTAISPHDPEPLDLDPDRMPREIGTLARSFDALATRLARVISDQRIFASAASHELRTPLAGALSQLDVLRRAPDRVASMDRLGEALSHMERLVTQLLFLARSDTVAASDRPERVDLAGLSRSVGDELGIGDRLGIVGAGAITGYPDLLMALLRNLLGNAVQTTASDTPIDIRIGAGEDGVRLAVLDRGPGIASAERQAVLEPFGQGRAGTSRGAGLGLTVAQRIAQLHGGGIEIADREGGGACVIAVLVGSPAVSDPGER